MRNTHSEAAASPLVASPPFFFVEIALRDDIPRAPPPTLPLEPPAPFLDVDFASSVMFLFQTGVLDKRVYTERLSRDALSIQDLFVSSYFRSAPWLGSKKRATKFGIGSKNQKIFLPR